MTCYTPFRWLLSKALAFHTQQLCIVLPVASASTAKLLPVRAAGESMGGWVLNTYRGVSFFELHCINREIPNLSKLARTGVQRDLPGKAVSPDRNV